VATGATVHNPSKTPEKVQIFPIMRQSKAIERASDSI